MTEDLNHNKVAPEADVLERAVLFSVNIIKRNIKKLLLITFIGGIAGGSVTYLLPKKYTSKAQLLPEFKESRFSNFSSLANLAGLDLTNSAESDAIRPDLYPNILQSTPALMYLLKKPVKSITNESFNSLIGYFEKLDGKKVAVTEITAKHSDNTVLNFSKEENQLLGNIKSAITTNFDKKSGIIYINVEMQDPVVAATVLSYSIEYITDFVSGYRAKKKHEQSEFIKSRVDEANAQLQKAEFALQRYRDNNRNVIMNVAKIEEQKLQSNYLHAQNLRNDLLNQMEQTRLAEQEGQPVIQILEPPVISTSKSSPSRIIYAVAGAFLTGLVSLIVISIRSK